MDIRSRRMQRSKTPRGTKRSKLDSKGKESKLKASKLRNHVSFNPENVEPKYKTRNRKYSSQSTKSAKGKDKSIGSIQTRNRSETVQDHERSRSTFSRRGR